MGIGFLVGDRSFIGMLLDTIFFISGSVVFTMLANLMEVIRGV